MCLKLDSEQVKKITSTQTFTLLDQQFALLSQELDPAKSVAGSIRQTVGENASEKSKLFAPSPITSSSISSATPSAPVITPNAQVTQPVPISAISQQPETTMDIDEYPDLR